MAAHPHLPLLASYGIDDDIKLWQFQSPSDSTDDKDAKEAKETQRFWYADNEHSQLPVLDFRLELSLQNVRILPNMLAVLFAFAVYVRKFCVVCCRCVARSTRPSTTVIKPGRCLLSSNQ